MSDGWDDPSAYGHVHSLPLASASEGPLRSLRLVARNSGLFYVAATRESLRLMETLAKRLASEEVWDQSAYNQEISRLAYMEHRSPAVSMRVMSYLCFLNTKTLFRYMRHDESLSDPGKHRPVSVHANYHPEKEMRMVSIRQLYLEGKRGALDAWNGGEGRNSGGCKGKVGVAVEAPFPALSEQERASHKLAAAIVAADERWVWPARGGGRWKFRSDGSFVAAAEGGAAGAAGATRGVGGAAGTWGTVPSQWRKDSLHVQLGDSTYILMFLSEKWAFTALRCRDEEVSFGQLERTDTPQTRLMW